MTIPNPFKSIEALTRLIIRARDKSYEWVTEKIRVIASIIRGWINWIVAQAHHAARLSKQAASKTWHGIKVVHGWLTDGVVWISAWAFLISIMVAPFWVWYIQNKSVWLSGLGSYLRESLVLSIFSYLTASLLTIACIVSIRTDPKETEDNASSIVNKAGSYYRMIISLLVWISLVSALLAIIALRLEISLPDTRQVPIENGEQPEDSSLGMEVQVRNRDSENTERKPPDQDNPQKLSKKLAQPKSIAENSASDSSNISELKVVAKKDPLIVPPEKLTQDNTNNLPALALTSDPFGFIDWPIGTEKPVIDTSISVCTPTCKRSNSSPVIIWLKSLKRVSSETIALNFTIHPLEEDDILLFVSGNEYISVGSGLRAKRVAFARAMHIFDERGIKYESVGGIRGLTIQVFNEHAYQALIPANRENRFSLVFPIPSGPTNYIKLVYPRIYEHQNGWELVIYNKT